MQKRYSNALFAVALALTPLQAAADVILYEHCDYQGYAIRLYGDGNYRLSDLIDFGMRNDDISSIFVEPGTQVNVRLYEHDDFQGRSYDVQGAVSDRCLYGTEFNDMISSVQVWSTPSK